MRGPTNRGRSAVRGLAVQFAFAVCAVFALAGCAPARSREKPSVTASKVPELRPLSTGDLLSQPADVEVTLHPPAIVRDRVYGPLLRRASALAAAYAGPRTLGTTALLALERTEEVRVETDESGEAVVVLLGVPADLDVTAVVDEEGRPVWKSVFGDVRQSFVEYEPANASDASLFVLPQRTWVVAAGAARARTREKLVEAPRVILATVSPAPGGGSFVVGGALASLTIRGSALVRREAPLRTGSLAPLGRSLLKASFELRPGGEGVIVAHLDYADAPSAVGAEETVRDVVGAFRRRLEAAKESAEVAQKSTPRVTPPPLSWLAAAGVERDQATVSVRAPIPKSWLDAIAQADLSMVQASPSTPSAADLPWGLWRRSTQAPTLAVPDSSAQEPSQPLASPLTRPGP
jgi:hypothetical protein